MIQNLANETLLITTLASNLMSATNSNCKGAKTKLVLPTKQNTNTKKELQTYTYISCIFWVFPSSSQCVPQDVPNSITLLSHMFIQYGLPKVELSWAPTLSLEMEVV
jgi:hypothetical protein